MKNSRVINGGLLTLIFILLLSVVFMVSLVQIALNLIDYPQGYIILFIQTLAGMLLMYLPYLFKRFGIIFAPLATASLAAFSFAALVMGSLWDFYVLIHRYDFILHFVSGFLMTLVSYSLPAIAYPKVKFGVGFLSVFAFSFAMLLGKIWEVWEFFLDSMFGSNTQTWAVRATGEVLVGQAALHNTMWDIIFNILGGLLACFIAFLAIKHNKPWLKLYQIRKG